MIAQITIFGLSARIAVREEDQVSLQFPSPAKMNHCPSLPSLTYV